MTNEPVQPDLDEEEEILIEDLVVFKITLECTKGIEEVFYALEDDKELIFDNFRHDQDIILNFDNYCIILKGDSFIRATFTYIHDQEFIVLIADNLIEDGICREPIFED